MSDATVSPASEEEGDRREAILQAAASLMARDGQAALTMRAIAAEAGCTTGAVYPIFSGKDEILTALLSRSLDRLGAAVAEAVDASEPGLPAFEAGFDAMADHFVANPQDLRIGFVLEADETIGDPGEKALNALVARPVSALAKALETAGVPDAPSFARSAFAALLGVLLLWQGRGRGLLDTSIEDAVARQRALVISAAIDMLDAAT